jgi:hypothetical protein
MINYKESTVAGSVYQRCRYVQIDNTLNAVPKMYCLEEEVIIIPDREPMRRDVSSIDLIFDPTSAIELINPETGEKLGSTVTHKELYVILHSLYIQAAANRDSEVPKERLPLSPLLPPKE